MTSRRISRDMPESSDDETVSLTSTVASEQKDNYPLEAILAERTINGITTYLVKWEGYDDLRCTWEEEENFQDEQTLLDWREQQMRIKRGFVKPFDVDAWERKVDDYLAATERRRALRRKRKIELGIPVADEESSSDDSSDDDYNEISDEEHNPDLQPHAPSLVWTAKEENTLLEGLNRFKTPDWKMFLRMYGPGGIINESLKEKTENDLQRKADGLRKDFEASGKEFPIPQSLEKSQDEDPDTRSKEKSVQNRRTQHKQVSRQTKPARWTEYTGTVHPSKPQTLPRAPSNDHERPERPRAKISPQTPDVAATKSASATLKGSASAKSKADPACASPQVPRRPSFPSATTERRPTQLGTIGRGPARRGLPVAKMPRGQSANVMKNWAAGPETKRKSRYEMRTPQEMEAKSGEIFKKFSTRRKFELAARYEHTPDVNSLTFVNLKDGKILPKGPTPVVSKPAAKKPFQLLQERLNEDQAGTPDVLDSTVRPGLQRAATADESVSGGTLASPDKQHIEGSDTTHPAVEATAFPQPARRASLPVNTTTQQIQEREPTFAAPVVLTKSGRVAVDDIISPKDRVSPQLDLNPQQKTDETANGTDISSKQASQGYRKQRPSLETVTSQAPSSSNPPAHNKQHPSRDRRSEPAHPAASKPALPQPMPCNPQLRGDGYTLFPLDTLPTARQVDSRLQPKDVIAEILTGNEGDSTRPVIFRGLESFDLKHLFITIRKPPRQMHVRCQMMCTAGEYATVFHVDSYLGSGWIVPYILNIEDVNRASGVLAEHASGGLFFAERFTLLIYPASCTGWEFLDGGFPSIPLDAKLRFAMFAPWPQLRESIEKGYPRAEKPNFMGVSQDVPMNAVLRSQFGMDFQRLIAQPTDKDGSRTRLTKTFFLIFPPSAQDEFDILVDWIQANGLATIYRHDDHGSWAHFSTIVDKGVIICHASFADYWAIPFLAHTLRKSINMFNFSLEPMSRLAPDPHLIRLFPAGMAILLTDSLFLIRPIEAARILSWVRLFALPTKRPGTWKACTRPAIREWLLKIQESLRYPYGKDFVFCYGELMRLLPSLMTKEWDREMPKDEAPIACMGNGMRNFDESLGTGVSSLAEMDNQAIIRNDNTLCSWFAGWAMTKQEKFRRFHIITGRDEEREQHKQLKERMRKYNHVEVVSFEKFAKTFDVWDWPKLKKHDDEQRVRAAEKDKAAAAKEAEQSRRGSAATTPNEDVEMQDVQEALEQNLFLPMDITP